jgi:hypothetical protein
VVYWFENRWHQALYRQNGHRFHGVETTMIPKNERKLLDNLNFGILT